MAGKPATERITVRINPTMLAFIDRARGEQTRGAYIRALIRADAQRKVLRGK